MAVDIADFKHKAVPGLYAFNHFEKEDGTFIQVHASGSPFIYRDAAGKFNEFHTLDALIDHLATV